MANETNFYSKKFTLYKETVKGVAPVTVDNGFLIKMLSFSLAESQAKETNPTLGAGGQAAKTDYGVSSFAGNFEVKYTGGIMPILLNHVIGKATKTAATADDWTDATAYTVGQIVNHSNATHSLVAKAVKGTGTSDSVEPDLTGLEDGDTIIDNPGADQIVWTVRVVLKKYSGQLESCLETCGIESEVQTGCEAVPVTFKERFGGLFFNTLELNKSGGNVIYKSSMPVVGMNRVDSEQVEYTDLVVTNEVNIPDNAFGFDDMTVSVAGSVPKDARSFSLTINRNTALEDALEKGTKVDNTPIPTVEGEVGLKFTLEEYKAAYENNSREVVITLAKPNGDSVVFTFPNVEFQRSPLSYSATEAIYLTLPLTAFGDSTVATVTYECISATDY